MNFNDIFEYLKQKTREELVKNIEMKTPLALSMSQIDENLGTNAEIRAHILQGSELVGKVSISDYDISLSQTEFDRLLANVLLANQMREQLGKLIRAEVDVILKEYNLIP